MKPARGISHKLQDPIWPLSASDLLSRTWVLFMPPNFHIGIYAPESPIEECRECLSFGALEGRAAHIASGGAACCRSRSSRSYVRNVVLANGAV